MQHEVQENPAQPQQPIVEVNEPRADHRFKENEIVSYLLDTGPLTMNDFHAFASFSRGGFSDEDRCQFAQLIGYSVGGFHSLSYVQRSDYQVDMDKRHDHHPRQPVIEENDLHVFKSNEIVVYLLEEHDLSKQELFDMGFSGEDKKQFLQLTECSLSEYDQWTDLLVQSKEKI